MNANILDIYDYNHDGFIEFDEFTDIEWGVFVPNLTEHSCNLTREGFIRTFVLSREEAPSELAQFHDFDTRAWGEDYDKIAKHFHVLGRGYLTKSDMANIFKIGFDEHDKNHDGKLTVEELSGVKPKPRPNPPAPSPAP